jgi:putative oxidoreductase
MGNTVVVIARILLGLIFVFFGAQGFVHFIPVPPIPGTAGAFLGAMETSHYVWFTSGVQLIAGLMLLANRYVRSRSSRWARSSRTSSSFTSR